MDTATVIVSIAGAFGLGNVVPLVIGKFFSRKQDNIAVLESNVRIYQGLIEDLQKKLNTYIRMTEKAMVDISALQTQLQNLFPWTCTVESCPRRKLMSAENCAINLTIDD